MFIKTDSIRKLDPNTIGTEADRASKDFTRGAEAALAKVLALETHDPLLILTAAYWEEAEKVFGTLSDRLISTSEAMRLTAKAIADIRKNIYSSSTDSLDETPPAKF